MIYEDSTYQEWRPAVGSKLYTSIEAQIAAAGEVEYMAQVVADLRQKQAEAQATAENIDWRSDTAPAAAAMSVLPVIATQIAAAEKDLTKAENALRLTKKAVDTEAGNLGAAIKRVQEYERLLVDVPGRLTESDRRKLEEAKAEFTRLSGVLLVA